MCIRDRVQIEGILNENGPDGIQRSYYNNGILRSEYPWKDGKPHGVFRKYDENGKLISQETWADGVKLEEANDENSL